jgi:hypothetical protein
MRNDYDAQGMDEQVVVYFIMKLNTNSTQAINEIPYEKHNILDEKTQLFCNT